MLHPLQFPFAPPETSHWCRCQRKNVRAAVANVISLMLFTFHYFQGVASFLLGEDVEERTEQTEAAHTHRRLLIGWNRVSFTVSRSRAEPELFRQTHKNRIHKCAGFESSTGSLNRSTAVI